MNHPISTTWKLFTSLYPLSVAAVSWVLVPLASHDPLWWAGGGAVGAAIYAGGAVKVAIINLKEQAEGSQERSDFFWQFGVISAALPALIEIGIQS
jgi:hypothetical protein